MKTTKEKIEKFEDILSEYICNCNKVDLNEFFEDEFRMLKGNWYLRKYDYQKVKIGIEVKYYAYENFEKIQELFPTMTDNAYYDIMGYEIVDFFDLWKEIFQEEVTLNLLCFGSSGGYFGFEIDDLINFWHVLDFNIDKVTELFNRLEIEDYDDDYSIDYYYYDTLYNNHDDIIDDIFDCLKLQDKFLKLLNEFIENIYSTKEYWKTDEFCNNFVDK